MAYTEFDYGSSVARREKRSDNDELIRTAIRAATVMSNGAESIRLIEGRDLPKNTSSGVRTHLLAVAERLEIASAALARASDLPDPSPSFLRRLAWAGPAAAIGLAAVTGSMEGVAGEVVQRMVQTEQEIGRACDAVVGAQGDGVLGPARIRVLPDGDPVSIYSRTEIDVPRPDGGDPMLMTVRPEPTGGIWVEVTGKYEATGATVAPIQHPPTAAATRTGDGFLVHSPSGDPARLSFAYAEPELLVARGASVSFGDKESIGRFGFVVLD